MLQLYQTMRQTFLYKSSAKEKNSLVLADVGIPFRSVFWHCFSHNSSYLEARASSRARWKAGGMRFIFGIDTMGRCDRKDLENVEILK